MIGAHAGGALRARAERPHPAQPGPALRLATRRSALALAQSRAVGERLCAITGRRLEFVEVVTTGDLDPAPLARIGGTGVFVAAVREAVARGEADLAVHSLKDLPTAADARLALAAVPSREDPRDALVTRTGTGLAGLPGGARVGTGSPRRAALLRSARPDLEIVDLRGNVDTRLSRVAEGAPQAPGADVPGSPPALDAVVLAVAGLARLARTDRISEFLDPALVVPAPGQGALAVEVRADLAADPSAADLIDALRDLDDPPTRAAVAAERALLAALEAGCSAPVGALGRVSAEGGEPTVHLSAAMAAPDGSIVHMSTSGPAGRAEEVGRRLAGRLLAHPAVRLRAGEPAPELGSPTG